MAAGYPRVHHQYLIQMKCMSCAHENRITGAKKILQPQPEFNWANPKSQTPTCEHSEPYFRTCGATSGTCCANVSREKYQLGEWQADLTRQSAPRHGGERVTLALPLLLSPNDLMSGGGKHAIIRRGYRERRVQEQRGEKI